MVLQAFYRACLAVSSVPVKAKEVALCKASWRLVCSKQFSVGAVRPWNAEDLTRYRTRARNRLTTLRGVLIEFIWSDFPKATLRSKIDKDLQSLNRCCSVLFSCEPGAMFATVSHRSDPRQPR